jgi:hypothetical protein
VLRKIEGEDKDALMTPNQIGVAWLDAARVAVLSREKGRLTQGHTREGEERSTRSQLWH